MHGVHIQAGWVRADGELIAVSFDDLRHAVSVSQHGIMAGIHVIARTLLFFVRSNLLQVKEIGEEHPPRNDE